MIASQFATISEYQDIVVAVASGRSRLDAQDELDSVPAKHLAQPFSEWCGLMIEEMRGCLDQGNLTTQAAYGLGHLSANRPASEYQQAPRHGLHAGRLAVAPKPLHPGESRDRGNEGI